MIVFEKESIYKSQMGWDKTYTSPFGMQHPLQMFSGKHIDETGHNWYTVMCWCYLSLKISVVSTITTYASSPWHRTRSIAK